MENFNALLTLSELKTLYSNKPVGICPLYKGSIGATKRFEASGNPVVIPEYVALEKLNIKFSPKQGGTGDPSPENVRAISGWDSVQVTRCGKNLLDPLYTTRYKSDIYWGKDSTGIRVVKGKTYTLSNNKNLICSGIYVKSKATNLSIFFNYNRTSLTFTASDTEDVYFQLYNTNGFEDAIELMLELSSAPTHYEPYQGDTYDIALPETIYGGTVDAVTGMGSKEWGYIASYNGETLPGEWISDRDVYSPGTTPTTGAQVAYKLATPEPFKTSQYSIPSIGSENTFFTNGENLDIIYKVSSFWG